MAKKYKVTGSGVGDKTGINVTLRLEEEGAGGKELFPTSPNMPDISCLSYTNQVYAGQLWVTYHSENTGWKKKDAIRNHALQVFKMSPADVSQMMDVFEHGCPEPPT